MSDELTVIRNAGQYVGNGDEQEVKCGNRPAVVKVRSIDRKYMVELHDGESITRGLLALGPSMQYRTTAITDGGITITDTGFTIGNSEAVNQNEVDYLWEVVF